MPTYLRDDTALEILGKLFEDRVFVNEAGAKISIIKRLKIITIPSGEYILKKGEIGTEMYFILEGKANVELFTDGNVITLIPIK